MKKLLTVYLLIVAVTFASGESSPSSIVGPLVQAENSGDCASFAVSRKVGKKVWITFGHAQKRVTTAEWSGFAQKFKSRIREAVRESGWTVKSDIGMNAPGRVPFDIVITGVKKSSQLEITATVFLSRDGVADVSFSETLKQ